MRMRSVLIRTSSAPSELLEDLRGARDKFAVMDGISFVFTTRGIHAAGRSRCQKSDITHLTMTIGLECGAIIAASTHVRFIGARFWGRWWVWSRVLLSIHGLLNRDIASSMKLGTMRLVMSKNLDSDQFSAGARIL